MPIATLEDLLKWHEGQRRLAMIAPMMSGDSLARSQVHEQAVKVLKASIASAKEIIPPATLPP